MTYGCLTVSAERVSTGLKRDLARAVLHPLCALHAVESALTPGDPIHE